MASLIPPNCGFVLYETRATRLATGVLRKYSTRLPASPGMQTQPLKPGMFRIPVDWAPTPTQFNLQPAQARAA